MRKFLITYSFISLFLASIYYYPSTFSLYIENIQTDITLFILKFFLDGNIYERYIQINEGYRLVITNECNGLIPIIVIFSAILAYSNKIYLKIKWLLISYILYTILNIIRILIITFVAFEYGQKSFFWTHDILGNGLLIIFGLFIFNLFVGQVKKHNSQMRESG